MTLAELENSQVIYLDFETAITRFFKNYVREGAWLRCWPSFFMQYHLWRPFHRKLFPFNYIKPGDTCVQVGCAEWMLDFGVSMALIQSAIVGVRGKVIVVEPDQRNIDQLQDYTKKHGIHNIIIVKKAAWKEKAMNTFTFYEDRSSTNVITEIEEASTWKHRAEYQNRQKRLEQIEMDTIDNIAAELGIKPDFVNLTVNGAELDIIRGMDKTIGAGTKVAWLFGDREWWRNGINFFTSKNYDVIVTDSAYSHRAPTVNGRVTTYSYKVCNELFDIMYAIAIPCHKRVPDPREYPATLYKRKDFDFIVKKIDTF